MRHLAGPKIKTTGAGAVCPIQRCDAIETAIAAHQMFCLPVWAGVTAGGLESFTPPAGISRFVIFGDNDANFTGQKSAFVLAHRLRRERPEIDIEVSIPDEPDSDWHDVL